MGFPRSDRRANNGVIMMYEQIHAMVQERRDEIVGRLQALVRIDTRNPYSGDPDCPGEGPGQEHLEPLLTALGAATVRFESPHDIYGRMGVIGPANRDFSHRPNLVGEWNFADEGPRVIVNGHMDTVGVTGMTIDPFAAEVRDGCVWGRGTSDCKGGLIAGLEAIRVLLDLDLPLAGSLVYESVMDEECSGSGAGTMACLDAGYTGDVAIFVDGNDLAMTLGCGGCLTADMDVTGQMGHAAAGTGVSAIEKALVVKQAIDRFKEERETARPHCRVNLGIFDSGVHAAVVPGTAHMSMNIVYDVEEAAAARDDGRGWGGAPVRERFEELVREQEAGDAWLSEHPTELTWVKDLIPFDQTDDGPWVQRLAGHLVAVTGREPVFNRMMAWSDAAFPAAMGQIPTILFGPALDGQAHGPEEHIVIDDLLTGVEVLARFLADAFEQR